MVIRQLKGDASTPQPATPAPPLESGDRPTRAEFERRYEAMRRRG
jgi:hypothetical protein